MISKFKGLTEKSLSWVALGLTLVTLVSSGSGCGSGARMTAPEAVIELYQVLHDAHEILTQEKVQYWVDGGTLLGSLRHKGIIPWDDDLDICIFPGEEGAFINLEDKFKKLGYEFRKIIATEDGVTHIGYKVYPIGKSYPFLDVLFAREKDGKIYYPTDALGFHKRREGDQLFMYKDTELLPLKLVQFGNYQVMAPQSPTVFMETLYGKDFMDVGYQTHVHTGAPTGKIKVILDDTTRKPAMPIDRTVSRIHLLNG